jgi:hypothetical protein
MQKKRRAALPPAVDKYGGAFNVQRLWEAVPPPPGLLAIGDCVQALNPVGSRRWTLSDTCACAAAWPTGRLPEGRRSGSIARLSSWSVDARGASKDAKEAAAPPLPPISGFNPPFSCIPPTYSLRSTRKA